MCDRPQRDNWTWESGDINQTRGTKASLHVPLTIVHHYDTKSLLIVELMNGNYKQYGGEWTYCTCRTSDSVSVAELQPVWRLRPSSPASPSSNARIDSKLGQCPTVEVLQAISGSLVQFCSFQYSAVIAILKLVAEASLLS